MNFFKREKTPERKAEPNTIRPGDILVKGARLTDLIQEKAIAAAVNMQTEELKFPPSDIQLITTRRDGAIQSISLSDLLPKNQSGIPLIIEIGNAPLNGEMVSAIATHPPGDSQSQATRIIPHAIRLRVNSFESPLDILAVLLHEIGHLYSPHRRASTLVSLRRAGGREAQRLERTAKRIFLRDEKAAWREANKLRKRYFGHIPEFQRVFNRHKKRSLQRATSWANSS